MEIIRELFGENINPRFVQFGVFPFNLGNSVNPNPAI